MALGPVGPQQRQCPNMFTPVYGRCTNYGKEVFKGRSVYKEVYENHVELFEGYRNHMQEPYIGPK